MTIIVLGFRVLKNPWCGPKVKTTSPHGDIECAHTSSECVCNIQREGTLWLGYEGVTKASIDSCMGLLKCMGAPTFSAGSTGKIYGEICF